jgi:hypothetical protein
MGVHRLEVRVNVFEELWQREDMGREADFSTALFTVML